MKWHIYKRKEWVLRTNMMHFFIRGPESMAIPSDVQQIFSKNRWWDKLTSAYIDNLWSLFFLMHTGPARSPQHSEVTSQTVRKHMINFVFPFLLFSLLSGGWGEGTCNVLKLVHLILNINFGQWLCAPWFHVLNSSVSYKWYMKTEIWFLHSQDIVEHFSFYAFQEFQDLSP